MQIDNSVQNFHTKNPDSNYFDQYVKDHMPRHEFMVKHFGLQNIKKQSVADFGCGRGMMFYCLDKSNQFTGFDGFKTPEDKKLVPFNLEVVNLDHDLRDLSEYGNTPGLYPKGIFDVSFCLEVCEHLGNVFQNLNNIKYMTKLGSDIFISIPDERMTHPVIYYQLFYPHTNFIDFLECMALPVKEKVLFDNGWPSWVFKCENRPWSEKKMKFFKGEEKFRNANLLEVTNL